MSTFAFTAWECFAGGCEGALDHSITWTAVDKSTCCRLLSASGDFHNQRKVHTLHGPVGSDPFCKGPVHICCLLFCPPSGSITLPRSRVWILAVWDGVVTSNITREWFWKAGAVLSCKHPELESWPARREKAFLIPSTVPLSLQFQLEWPHWLDTDTLAPGALRSYGGWLNVLVNRMCSVKRMNWLWAHRKRQGGLPVLYFSSRCLTLVTIFKRSGILLTS